jgi:hypothetical protein
MGSGCESNASGSPDSIAPHERGRAGIPYWGYTHSPAIFIMLWSGWLICVIDIPTLMAANQRLGSGCIQGRP